MESDIRSSIRPAVVWRVLDGPAIRRFRHASEARRRRGNV
jgi:hypothetical protein